MSAGSALRSDPDIGSSPLASNAMPDCYSSSQLPNGLFVMFMSATGPPENGPLAADFSLEADVPLPAPNRTLVVWDRALGTGWAKALMRGKPV